MFVVVIALIGAYANLYNDGQDFVKQGCRPVAFNSAGMGTMWDCPPGVTKGVGVNP